MLANATERRRVIEHLRKILADPTHGLPIRDDLGTGMSALPIWMQDFVREVIGDRRPGGGIDGSQQMNDGFKKFIAASKRDRIDIFLAWRCALIGAAVQNVEKDFWVCWTLNALYHGLPCGSPRLLFKRWHISVEGSTTSSGVFLKTSDITVFREDLHQAASIEHRRNCPEKSEKQNLTP